MHIGIDIGAIAHKSGLGRYVYNIVDNLTSIDEENEYTLFFNSLRGNIPDLSLFNNRSNVKLCIARFPNISSPDIVEKVKNKVFYPALLKKKDIDVFHVPTGVPVFRKNMKTILTIHDLIHLIWPSQSDKYYIRNIRLFSKNTNIIIADSLNTKRDIMKLLDIEENKIKVIYPGVEERFKPITNQFVLDRVREKYKIEENFILFTGRLDPRKNIVTLIKAFHKLVYDNGLKYKLVIMGEKKLDYKNLVDMIQELGVENDLIFTGYVPDEDLPVLLSAADLFVYPSFYEGFGFPPLEAMACGTPVISSNVSSIPEVVSDAGILIDPNSVDELVDAMYRVLTDLTLRRTLVEKGIERAKLFSWKNAALETLRVYKEIL